MRYDNSKILRDENNTRYLNRVEYPVISIQDSDTFILGVFIEFVGEELLPQ